MFVDRGQKLTKHLYPQKFLKRPAFNSMRGFLCAAKGSERIRQRRISSSARGKVIWGGYNE